MRNIVYPCPYPPGGMCPPECITSDGPLCDSDDDCPYTSRRKINKIARSVISDKCMPGMEDDNIVEYLKELQDKIYHCLYIPTSVKDGITATEIQKQKEHDFLKYVRGKTMDYENSMLASHERNKIVSITSEALETIKFSIYLMERCKEVIDNLDKKHPHFEELCSIYSLMQNSISKMGEESYFLIELYRKFKAFNSDKSTEE